MGKYPNGRQAHFSVRLRMRNLRMGIYIGKSLLINDAINHHPCDGTQSISIFDAHCRYRFSDNFIEITFQQLSVSETLLLQTREQLVKEKQLHRIRRKIDFIIYRHRFADMVFPSRFNYSRLNLKWRFNSYIL